MDTILLHATNILARCEVDPIAEELHHAMGLTPEEARRATLTHYLPGVTIPADDTTIAAHWDALTSNQPDTIHDALTHLINQ